MSQDASTELSLSALRQDHRAGTLSKKHFVPSAAYITPIISSVTSARRTCRSKDKDLCPVVVTSDSENSQLLGKQLSASRCWWKCRAKWTHPSGFSRWKLNSRFCKHFIQVGEGMALELESWFISVFFRALKLRCLVFNMKGCRCLSSLFIYKT